MLRKLLAGLIIGTGAQFLLPPVLVESIFANLAFLDSAFAESTMAVAAELSEIRDRGHLIVGIKTNRPPLGFINETGNLDGFEIEIARRLASDLLGDEAAVQFVPLSNVERINAVLEDRVDIAIAAITLTEPRRRLVNFSDPYYLDGTGFIVQPNIQTLQDLRFSKIAVLNRSSTIAHARYILPAAKLVGVDSYEAGQRLLNEGKADAFAGDVSVLVGWTSEHGQMSSYTVLPNVISAEPLSIALPKGTAYGELQTAINQSIRQWYAEEWLQARAEFWALPSGILPMLSQSDSQPELEPEPSSEPDAESLPASDLGQ